MVPTVLQAIRSAAGKYRLLDASQWSKLERFVATGDDESLRALQPVASRDRWVLEDAVKAIADARSPSEEELRTLRALAHMQLHILVAKWLKRALENSQTLDEDFCGQLRALYDPENFPAAAVGWAVLDECHQFLERDGMPTSAGRFLLSLADSSLDHVIAETFNCHALCDFLLTHSPQRVERALNGFLRSKSADIAQSLLSRDPRRYEPLLAARVAESKNTAWRFEISAALSGFNREKYKSVTSCIAREVITKTLGKQDRYPGDIQKACRWLLHNERIDALADLDRCFVEGDNPFWLQKLFDDACRILGRDARPLALTALRRTDQLQRAGLAKLIEWNDAADAALIAQSLREGIGDNNPTHVMFYVGLASRWNVVQFLDELWTLTGHKSKPVREAGARALAKAGDAIIPKASELLRAKKAMVRASAVTALAVLKTDAALAALEQRFDEEADDEIRDQMLLALESAWEARGRKIDRSEIERRVQRAAARLQVAVVPWLNEQELPPLRFVSGETLELATIRYLLYRQSRAKEMRPDVEVKSLYALIDRATSGEFAIVVLKSFLSSPMDAQDRWALAVAALLGDDRIVPIINEQIRAWADNNRGKLAEYAAQAIALLNTDAALSAVDSLSLRYRSKQKNIGKAASEAFADAAARLGLTPDELGDRVVPWLGFEPGRARTIAIGSRQLEARIANDFKFELYDVEKKKRLASLPAGTPAELKNEFKDLAALVREVVKGQLARLENLMVRQFRWPVARWREPYLRHPLLFPFARRLVWGWYNSQDKLQQTFRALEDHTLTDERDEPVELPPDGQVGIIHPLELSAEQRQAWRTHLADYAVDPPFQQIERSVISPASKELDTRLCETLRGTRTNGMTFKGRAERLGWQRGSVCDGGCIPSYHKSFPGAGVDAFLKLDGMFIGIDMDSSVELMDYGFVTGGSVQIGSYVYDEPANSDDERLIAFGEVPPVVFSETLGDLKKIAGTQTADPE